MNKKLFMLLFGLGQKHKIFGRISYITAKYSYNFFYTVYAAGFIMTLYIRKSFLPAYIVVPFSVYIINNTVRKILNKKRPFQELDITPLIKHKNSPSCPSNHTACAMVISLTFLKAASFGNSHLLILMGIFFIICGIFTGISRVVCGIHYPRDIFLGYIIGIFCFFAEMNIIFYVF